MREPPQRNFGFQNLDLGDIRLRVLDNKHDSTWYQRRESYEELHSPFYAWLDSAGFKTMVDVGANYGLVSLLTHLRSPGISIIAIEADSRLIPCLEQNFKENSLTNAKIVNAVVGDISNPQHTSFSLNPLSTLDNRVSMADWEKIEVPQIVLDDLQNQITPPWFLKIDTQGYEKQVFDGASGVLANCTPWLIKTEFAPHWLNSQGTSPLEFLTDLTQRYRVYECPPRFPYSFNGIPDTLGKPINPDEAMPFVNYVTGLNSEQRGWVDLLITSSDHVFVGG